MRLLFNIALLLFISGCKQATRKIIEKYSNGQIKTEYIYPDKQDSLTFLCNIYYESGKLKHKVNVVSGKFIGDKITYFENGKLQRIERLTFPTALDDSEYDCHITNYHSNGTKESDYKYKNKKVNGLSTDYDSLGNIVRTGEYVNGKLNGKSTLYFPNGRIRSIAQCRNDSAYGFEYEFSETGDTLKAVVHYGLSVDGIFYKKWLPNRIVLTGGYGDSDKTYVIWKWTNTNGREIRHKLDSGTLVKNDYRRFVAPD